MLTFPIEPIWTINLDPASLWFASSGMGAIIEGLNVAYDVKETRAWWRRTLLAILLTIALAVLIITALALMFYGSRIAEGIANHYGFGAAFTTVWKVLRWVFVVVFVFLASELIYYFAPDLNTKQLRWLAPGAMTGLVLWLLVSFLFGSYLNFYNNYSVVYGSLGGGHHSDAVVLHDWCDDFSSAARLTPSSSKQQLAPETISRKRQGRSFPMKARWYARQERSHHRMLKQLSNKSSARMPPQPFMILRYTTNKSVRLRGMITPASD